jgi:hypothetical protein
VVEEDRATYDHCDYENECPHPGAPLPYLCAFGDTVPEAHLATTARVDRHRHLPSHLVTD